MTAEEGLAKQSSGLDHDSGNKSAIALTGVLINLTIPVSDQTPHAAHYITAIMGKN
jgi:hypothetical protein